jgi:hypothetical protein
LGQLQRPVDGRPADAERLGDIGRPHTLRLQFAYPCLVYRRRAAFVDASGLGLGDALKLALAAQMRFGIVTLLQREIAGAEPALPLPGQRARVVQLKAYEGTLDAVICAWAAVCALERAGGAARG